MAKLLVALELLLIALGITWVTMLYTVGADAILLLAWDGLALIYLATGWLLLRRTPASADEHSKIAGPRWFTVLFTLVASLSGLAAGFALMIRHQIGDDPVVNAIASGTVLASWLLLHGGYARLYARAFAEAGGLRFPECREPQLAEFVYFSLTLGTSFAVSDVEVTTSAMRRRVTAHSVLSFFFNAAIVALAISVLTTSIK
jgi:uncharacterized membrane protein